MFRVLLVISSLILSAIAQNTAPKNKWQTLTGQEPIVIARGGLSGLFPESSSFANQMAVASSLSNTVLYCNLQLTKDGIGICLSDIRLENSTNIDMVFPKNAKTYNVNGKDVKGWFSSDFTSTDLFDSVFLIQSTFSRPSAFDGTLPISAVEDVVGIKPYQFWLNAQYDTFYKEHDLSMTSYVEKALRFVRINYISSAEIGFLKSMTGKINKARTKLIFQFLGANDSEPTTAKTYGALAQDLAFVKTFASGILIPKEYIWPVNDDKYLEASTTVVADAHKLGLEVYASGFANDLIGSYNYSSDPINEYLQFLDNGEFAVDGVLTDFAPTASEAIACFSGNKTGPPKKGKQALVISRNGASGIFPGSTDLAYQQAVDDGADVIDCSVQLSKDGVAFCLDSADLSATTTAIPPFISRTSTVPEIQPAAGIFCFDLSWSEIQSLKPQMSNPFQSLAGISRNPANKLKGKLVTLSEFLEFAKTKAVSGLLISIKNAPYLASKKGLDIVAAVSTALSNATFDKQSTQRVFIESDDTSVLSKFSSVPTYTRVLTIEEKFGNVAKQPMDEIKKFANAVAITRSSVVKISDFFTTGLTKVVPEMKAANISVFVYVFRNEFITLAFDYFADPNLEIATFVDAVGVDGIITEYPATASRYMKCPCRVTEQKDEAEYTILPPQIGSMLELIPVEIKPPAEAPMPPLEVADVVDPPLPPVAQNVSAVTPAAADAPNAKGSAVSNVAEMFVSVVWVMVISLVLV